MMTDIERCSKFQEHYNRYLVKHVIILMLNMLFVETVIATFVLLFCKMVKAYGVQGIKIVFLFVMVAVPIGISCIAFMSVLDYAKEMLILYQRRFRFETGTITKKKRSMYEIETLQLSNAQHSKYKKRKDKYILLRKGFIIKSSCRESEFQIGDKITILLATTRLLQANGFDASWRTYSSSYGPPRFDSQGYAIYAFMGDPPANLFETEPKFSTKQCKTTFWSFVVVTALFLVLIIFVMIF